MTTPLKKPTVLVTGASTGIGRTCALELAQRGCRVFAGVRKTEDGELLQAQNAAVTPLLLDVTDQSAISGAARTLEVELAGSGLDGLLNNAGISLSGPLECLPLELFERVMRVNATGQLAVTQAFLPLLRRAQGRIVFMSSESGRFTLPLLGAYSASKFALEAVANAFRLELAPANIRVSVVEPGSIQSPIWQKAMASSDAWVQSVPRAVELYGDEIAALRGLAPLLEQRAIAPAHVSRAVIHALTSKHPKARYVVGAEARLMLLFFALLPTKWADFWLRFGMRWFGRRLSARSTA
jgi:NAD(P)-dependent dehydrogenase (short-subunit alcohol dehydrogenase family)